MKNPPTLQQMIFLGPSMDNYIREHGLNVIIDGYLLIGERGKNKEFNPSEILVEYFKREYSKGEEALENPNKDTYTTQPKTGARLETILDYLNVGKVIRGCLKREKTEKKNTGIQIRQLKTGARLDEKTGIIIYPEQIHQVITQEGLLFHEHKEGTVKRRPWFYTSSFILKKYAEKCFKDDWKKADPLDLDRFYQMGNNGELLVTVEKNKYAVATTSEKVEFNRRLSIERSLLNCS